MRRKVHEGLCFRLGHGLGGRKPKKYDFACECLGFKYFGHLFYDQSDCLIQPPIKVCIDGKDMNWTTDHLQITELSDSGKIPTYLVLTGRVVNVELTCKENTDEFVRNTFSWRFTSPVHLQDKSVFLPPEHVDEGEGRILSSLLLLLLHRTWKTMPDEVRTYRFLLLRPGL
ncbi:hypothetical protein B0T09DRAFT_55348 [Sordaria sp. MPI-SDFR-AT-0083]|nr:hypothetical protein B0T09DRAFT_55348 [Sordaria sp. MPI-SDFR-AT-0083]